MSTRTALRDAAGGADRVVVVDTETTGVYPTDRVVEIGLVTLSLDGQVLDEWETLVQPERDVGATFIHGVTASMVADAPVFAEVAGDVAVRLDGACLAAHNLFFDVRMLSGEFERLGAELTVTAGLDTLRATRAKLGDACESHGVRLSDAHRALSDAMAAAELLCCVIDRCDPGAPAAVPTALTRSGRIRRREDAGPVSYPDPPLIAYLASRLSYSGVEADTLAYLELVDRAVADLHLDRDERDQLAALALSIGLDEAHIAQAHRRFVNELVDAAVADDEVIAEEYETLVRVAAALDVDQQVIENRTRSYRTTATAVTLGSGLSVVFTGDDPDLPRPEMVEHALSLGLDVAKGVTKETGVLIAADPESRSGKAKKAHRYGIPVVALAEFARASAGMAVTAARSTVDSVKVITCPDCLATWTVPGTSSAHASQRCDDCAPLRPPSSPRGRTPRPPAAPSTEELTCESCGRTWNRPRTRGRKPRACSDCAQ